VFFKLSTRVFEPAGYGVLCRKFFCKLFWRF